MSVRERLAALTALTAATGAALAGSMSPATSATSVTAAMSTVSAVSLPRTTLTASARDLGTLGGATSRASDVDGAWVVGSSLTPGGQWHAFAYDLRDSTMRDLGTLGGPDSNAVAVAGTLVAGTSTTAGGMRHAFVYDLAAPGMRDLGTLVPGGTSEAADVDGGVVVSQSGPTIGRGHAFAYDVATATLRDLGDLGLGDSAAAAVDSGTVVGTAFSRTTDRQQPFAHDLATSTSRAVGPLRYSDGNATDVTASVVGGTSFDSDEYYSSTAYVFDLGSSTRRDLPGIGRGAALLHGLEGRDAAGTASVTGSLGPHVVTWDLTASTPAARDRGWLGGTSLLVADVRDGVVVGQAARAGDDRVRAFAIDLRSSRPWLTDLGTVGGYSGSAVAVSGRTVVGWSSTATHAEHATAWTLRTTMAPSFRLAQLRPTVQESVGAARVTVLRDGNASRAASVHYVVRDPRSGHDIVPVSGTLRFAAGQVRRSLSVPVRDDGRTEPDEPFLVALGSPSSGALLGTPATGTLVVRASDQRPDASIAAGPQLPRVGEGVRNSTGAHQTRTVTVRRGVAHDFPVLVKHTGNPNVVLVLRGTAARPGSTVRYFYGEVDVTRQMRSTSGRRVRLSHHGATDLTVRITATRSAAAGSLKPARVSVTWRGDGTRTDVVRAVVRVAR